MAYLNNIPQPTDVPSSSQNDILNNFSSLNTQFSVDHVALIAGSNNGYHTKVTFNDVQSDPTISSPQTELYTKASSNATANDRYNDLYYYEKNVTGTSSVIQLTGGGVTAGAWCQFNGTTVGTNAPSQEYNVTSVTRNSTGNYTINFTRSFTTSTYCAQVLPSINGTGVSIQVTVRAAGSLTFQVRNGSSAIDPNDCSVLVFGILV